MTKYSKGITIYRLKIIVSDKNSFDECNKAILEELVAHPELDAVEKAEIIRVVLNEN